MLELCLNIWIKVLTSWCGNLIKDCKKKATETLLCGKAFFNSLAVQLCVARTGRHGSFLGKLALCFWDCSLKLSHHFKVLLQNRLLINTACEFLLVFNEPIHSLLCIAFWALNHYLAFYLFVSGGIWWYSLKILSVRVWL